MLTAAETYDQLNKRLSNQKIERSMLGHILNSPADQIEILTELKRDHFSHNNHAVLYGMYLDLFQNGCELTWDAVNNNIDLRAKNAQESMELKELLQTVSGLTVSDTVFNTIHVLKELLKNRKIYNEILLHGSYMFHNNESTEKIMAHMSEVLVSIDTGKQEQDIEVIVDNVVDRILNPHISDRGLQTGITEFDLTFGGIKQDRYITIAAEPGAGKTGVTIDLLARLSEMYPSKVAILFFSMEMSEDRVAKRFISRSTHMTNERLDARLKGLDKDQREKVKNAGERIKKYPMEIVYQTLTCSQIELRVKKFALEHQGKHLIIVLDHIGLVSGATNEIRINTIQASQTMKSFCRDYNATSIVLTQLKKEVGNLERRKTFHMPTLSDIMESGQIHQDSDILLMLWRPEMRFVHIPYQENEQWITANKLIMLNEKNRDGQPFTHIVTGVNIGCNLLYNTHDIFN